MERDFCLFDIYSKLLLNMTTTVSGFNNTHLMKGTSCGDRRPSVPNSNVGDIYMSDPERDKSTPIPVKSARAQKLIHNIQIEGGG